MTNTQDKFVYKPREQWNVLVPRGMEIERQNSNHLNLREEVLSEKKIEKEKNI